MTDKQKFRKLIEELREILKDTSKSEKLKLNLIYGVLNKNG